MKRTMLIITVLLVILMVACSRGTAQPIPSTTVEPPPAVVSASGKVLPARWATLSFQVSGRVMAVDVQIGDQVKAGDVLARLDDTDARLAVAQAEAALALAQAQLAQVRQPARQSDVAAAQAALDSARASYEKVKAGPTAEDLAAAKAALTKTQLNLQRLRAGASTLDLQMAKLSVDSTRNQLWAAQAERDAAAGDPRYGSAGRDAANARVHVAEVAVDMAQVNYEKVKQGARAEDLAIAQAQVEEAQAAYNALLNHPTPSELAAAAAQVAQAQAQLDLLKAGATGEQIAVAEANVKQARAALDVAKAQLAKLQLVMPFDGTVGAVLVRQGELVTPGQSLLMVGDVRTLRVETTDLSELDVARLREGQPVTVTFDAVAGLKVGGKVARIAPMSTPGQSGVNYAVLVELERLDAALRWGMTAFVDIQVGQ